MPLDAVVRSMLIEGTTTTDSSSRFFWIESHAAPIDNCRSSNARYRSSSLSWPRVRAGTVELRHVFTSFDCVDVVDSDRPTESLGLHVADYLGDGHVLDGGENAVGDQHLPGPGVRAQARGQIGDAADRGVVEAAFEADPAERRVTLGDPMPESQIVSPTTPPNGQLFHRIADLQRHPYSAFGGVVMRDRIVEEHHDAVTGEPLESALICVDQRSHRPVVLREHAHHLLGLAGLGERREVPQICEEHDDLTAMAFEKASRRR